MSESLKGSDPLELLKKSGAYLEGHFLLTSGLHSPAYVEKFEMLQHPAFCDEFCRQMADKFASSGATVVLGPATGGILLAYIVARALGPHVRGIFMERDEGNFVLKRGFHIKPDDKILLVEDVITTGKSMVEVWDALGEDSKKVLGLAYMIDRSGGKFTYPVKKEAVLSINLPTYKPEECPLCAQGVKLTKRGSRKF